jgi:hypothetical protein
VARKPQSWNAASFRGDTEFDRVVLERLAHEIPPTLTLAELPKWIGLSERTIRRLRAQNRFPLVPMRSFGTTRVIFSGAAVLRYLETNGKY